MVVFCVLVLDFIRVNCDNYSMASLILISAPSGAGKTTLVNKLLGALTRIELSVSCTTRSPRPSEKQGDQYHFMSDDEYDQCLSNNEFLEFATVYGNRYGTLKKNVQDGLERGNDVVLEIDYQGALQVMKAWKEPMVSVFIMPPSFEVLRKRLDNRAEDTPSVIKKRLQEAYQDIIHYDHYDYLVVNGDLLTASLELTSIVVAYRHRMEVVKREKQAWIESLIESFNDKS